MDPYNLIGDAVQRGVVLRAGERRRVDLDTNDNIPVGLKGKGDGVAACAGKEVDNDAGVVWGGGVVISELGCDLVRDGLGCYAEPGSVCQVDT